MNRWRFVAALAIMAAGNLLFVNLNAIDNSRNDRASSNRPRPMSGSLISANGGAVRGWALDTENPGTFVAVSLELNGVVVGEATANSPDAVVADAFGSNNSHAFTLSLPAAAFTGTQRLDLYVRNGEVRQLVSTSSLNNGTLTNGARGQL